MNVTEGDGGEGGGDLVVANDMLGERRVNGAVNKVRLGDTAQRRES